MAGRVGGEVAFITGAARGQGRSHALRPAEEGGDVVAVDVAAPIPGRDRSSEGASPAVLDGRVAQVEALERRIVAVTADVGDVGALNNALAKGVRHTAKAAVPRLQQQGTGGSIVLTSSTAVLMRAPDVAAYTAGEHAVVGIMRTLAHELAPSSIRVDIVHPAGVDTRMIRNEATYGLLLPDTPHPADEQVEEVFRTTDALPIPWVDPVEISNPVLLLASDGTRCITGLELKVDAGSTLE